MLKAENRLQNLFLHKQIIIENRRLKVHKMWKYDYSQEIRKKQAIMMYDKFSPYTPEIFKHFVS